MYEVAGNQEPVRMSFLQGQKFSLIFGLSIKTGLSHVCGRGELHWGDFRVVSKPGKAGSMGCRRVRVTKVLWTFLTSTCCGGHSETAPTHHSISAAPSLLFYGVIFVLYRQIKMRKQQGPFCFSSLISVWCLDMLCMQSATAVSMLARGPQVEKESCVKTGFLT